MATQHSNNYKEKLLRGTIHFGTDTFKVALMNSSFVYNPATHDAYSNISGSEMPTAAGYTIGGATLAGVTITCDDLNNKVSVTWNTVTWTATADLGPISGAIIYHDTPAAGADKTVVGFLDFGTLKTVLSGGTLSLPGIKVESL